jgi:hypothetical protein
MSLQVNLPPHVIAALKQLMKLENDAEAVERAAGEYLRLTRLRELKNASGRVEFEENWQKLGELELGEVNFPQ